MPACNVGDAGVALRAGAGGGRHQRDGGNGAAAGIHHHGARVARHRAICRRTQRFHRRAQHDQRHLGQHFHHRRSSLRCGCGEWRVCHAQRQHFQWPVHDQHQRQQCVWHCGERRRHDRDGRRHCLQNIQLELARLRCIGRRTGEHHPIQHRGECSNGCRFGWQRHVRHHSGRRHCRQWRHRQRHGDAQRRRH